jgi:hypothetical protein
MYSDRRTLDLGWGFGIRVGRCWQRFLTISWAFGAVRLSLPGYTTFSFEDVGDIRHSRIASSR